MCEVVFHEAAKPEPPADGPSSSDDDEENSAEIIDSPRALSPPRKTAKTDLDAVAAVRHALDVIHGVVAASMETTSVCVSIEPPSAARQMQNQITFFEASQHAENGFEFPQVPMAWIELLSE